MRIFYSLFVLIVNLVAIKLMFKLFFEIYPHLTYHVHASKEHWILPLALFNLSFLLYMSKESRLTPAFIKKHISKHHLSVLIVSIIVAVWTIPQLVTYGGCGYSSSFAVREAHKIDAAIDSFYAEPDNTECVTLEDLNKSREYEFKRTDCHIASGIKKIGAYIHCEGQVEKLLVTTYIVPNRLRFGKYYTVDVRENNGVWSHEWPYNTPEPLPD